MIHDMTTLQQAEAADHALVEEMDRLVIVKSTIYTSGERDPREPQPRQDDKGKLYLMGHDPRLPRMPDGPRCSTSSSIASGPPPTCCRARGWPRRTA